MLSLKQIGTICFTTILSLFISPSYSYITNSSGCNQGVLHTTSAPAALEANYSANTINTTWYSNGTTLSGNGVPSSCIYDAALVPPTPDSRPGYAFGGWRVHVAPSCNIPSTDVSNNAEYKSIGCLDINGDGTCAGKGGFDQNAPNYGISNPGQWGVTWSNGDKVVGEALCSQTSGTSLNTGTPDETGSGDTKYCWCKATHYTANNAQQCSLSSPSWVFLGGSSDCASSCASECAGNVQYYPALRATLFGGNIAQ